MFLSNAAMDFLSGEPFLRTGPLEMATLRINFRLPQPSRRRWLARGILKAKQTFRHIERGWYVLFLRVLNERNRLQWTYLS